MQEYSQQSFNLEQYISLKNNTVIVILKEKLLSIIAETPWSPLKYPYISPSHLSSLMDPHLIPSAPPSPPLIVHHERIYIPSHRIS